MTKFLEVNETRAIEQEANAHGISSDQMLEYAGSSLADIIEAEFGYLAESGVLGLVGPGNNGSTTLIALFYLAKRGWRVAAFIIGKRSIDDPLVYRLKDISEIKFSVKDDNWIELDELLTQKHVWVDGILGTGVKLPLSNQVSNILSYIHKKAD